MFPNYKSVPNLFNLFESSSSFINHHICNFDHLLLHSSFSATSITFFSIVLFLQLFSNFPMNMDPYPHDDDGVDDDILSPVSLYVCPCGRSVRVYSVSHIGSGDFHHEILAQLRFYRPLPYPYTWYIHREEVAVVNVIDLQAHHQIHHPSYYQPQQEAIHHDGYHYQYSEAIDAGYQTHPYQHSEAIDAGNHTHRYQRSEYVDETEILEDLNMNQINESFEQASD
ncbi:hypothetical protein L6452_37385 [Arctium lappa]|uniref:Uncharacterized protein n=1 Tax=Arctium lappa TaxID=4217 RepID=A0ACB8Y707_ARCLA|nr:hypothetical protein L6452_37385 [Arctium lappa]